MRNGTRDEAPLVAGQIADVAEAIGGMRDALVQRTPHVTVNMPEQPITFRMAEQQPPNVHMHFAEPPPAPEVHVRMPDQPAPVVNVEPIINVLPPVARVYNVRITERDENGFILAFRITPA